MDVDVVPGTSQIHSETFAQALGGRVVTDPTSAWAFFVGVSPHLKPVVESHAGRNVAYWIGTDSAYALADDVSKRDS